MPGMTKGRGESVSPPDIELWIYGLRLGNLSRICPFCEQETANKVGIVCSAFRKTSSVQRSLGNLGE